MPQVIQRQGKKPVERLPHIGGLDRQVNVHRQREAQHRDRSQLVSTAAIAAGSIAAGSRNTTPPGRMHSMDANSVETDAGASSTDTNRACLATRRCRFLACRTPRRASSRRHAWNEGSLKPSSRQKPRTDSPPCRCRRMTSRQNRSFSPSRRGPLPAIIFSRRFCPCPRLQDTIPPRVSFTERSHSSEKRPNAQPPAAHAFDQHRGRAAASRTCAAGSCSSQQSPGHCHHPASPFLG